MPELPEVEHAARVLRAAVVGRTVRDARALHRAQRRHLTARSIARLRGARIERVERRGKHQLLALSTGDTLVVRGVIITWGSAVVRGWSGQIA